MAQELQRFTQAQETTYQQALEEIKNGCKRSHWMWFIYPQVKGLGKSGMAQRYAINDLAEATAYLNHPVLGTRLVEISSALLAHKNKTASQIMGSPDDVKLRSSMTLFAQVPGADPVFQQVLNQFFKSEQDQRTLELLQQYR